MEQTINRERNRKIFSEYIADPSAITPDSTETLRNLLDRFPYSQLLRSFYVRSLADKDPEIFKKELAKAALFSPDRSLLQIIIEDPSRLVKASGEHAAMTEDLTAEPAGDPIPDTEHPAREEITAVAETEEIRENPQDIAEETEASIPEPKEKEEEPDLLTQQNTAGTDHPAEEAQEKEQEVSRYDDDTMPYTFLWWLNKTRKEHSDTYQPYVSFRLDTSQSISKDSPDPLDSQIIENIFHLQPGVSPLENAPRTVPFQIKRREDQILEKFIREEPQIKAPNSDKLDSENKARKSSEDPNDLVSETLARIYAEQMLFHKAIDTYKKLSLKFPEKSTYFADQILDLEKKIN